MQVLTLKRHLNDECLKQEFCQHLPIDTFLVEHRMYEQHAGGEIVAFEAWLIEEEAQVRVKRIELLEFVGSPTLLEPDDGLAKLQITLDEAQLAVPLPTVDVSV